MKHVAIRVLFPALLSAACHSAGTPDPAADRQAIAAATARFGAAESAGSVDQFRGFFTDDLVMMGPNEPLVIGGDSVAALMVGFQSRRAATTCTCISVKRMVPGNKAESCGIRSDLRRNNAGAG